MGIALNWLLLLVPLSLSAAASLEDIKTKDLPDIFTHAIFAFGLLYRLFWAFSLGESGQLFATLGITLLFSVFGAAMYYAKQWGGGDSKLLAGFGATIAVPPREVLELFSPALGPFPFWLALLINIFVTGTLYGTLYTFGVIWSKGLGGALLERMKKEAWQPLFFLALFSLLLSWSGLSSALPLLFALTALLWTLAEGARVVEEGVFVREIGPEKLRVEDWLLEDVVVDGEKIADSNSPGVSEEELERVMEKKEKIGKVKIKDGMAFGPTFPVALCLTLLCGDLTFRAVLLFSTCL